MTATREELEEMVRLDRAEVFERKKNAYIIDDNTHEDKKTRPDKRVAIDEKLDRLYVKNVRCPYCRALIPQYTGDCIQCGITKEQISKASWQDAKKIRKGEMDGKIIMTKRRPNDLQFGKFIIFLVFFGWMGAHNFFVGRKIRGWIMCISFWSLLLSNIIWSIGTPANNFMDVNQFRNSFNFLFPFDIPGLVAIIVWFCDWFAVVIFNQYKYPVHIRPKKEKESIIKLGEEKPMRVGNKHTNRRERRREEKITDEN